MMTSHPEGGSSSRLRKRVREPRPLLIPGVQDALTARIFEHAGFESICVGGYAAAATSYALPDIGLVTQTEMARHIARIADAVAIPLIADADTGYGEIVNVVRTVREYERAGAAAILIEDQTFPKRCGNMEGKQLIPAEAMAEKVRAAVTARLNPATVIVARTDALGVSGLADAIHRCKLYAAAGADWIFPDAPTSVEQMRVIGQTIDLPLVADMVEESQTPMLALQTLFELGWRVVLYPATALRAAAHAIETIAISLREHGTSSAVSGELMQLDNLHDLLRLAEWQELEQGAVKVSPDDGEAN